jgi:hypothetical protein
MPSHSAKQHKFMEAIAHSPSFAKKVGVPQSVGKDFASADKGRKFSKGGNTMATQMDPRVMKMMLDMKHEILDPNPCRGILTCHTYLASFCLLSKSVLFLMRMVFCSMQMTITFQSREADF